MGMMGLWGLVFSRFTWILAFLLCVSPHTVKTQIPGCSMVGVEVIEQCLKPSNGFTSIDKTCCTALNQMVQAGQRCLCSLQVAESLKQPLLGTPLSLPLSNCYVSAPPLSQCQVVAPDQTLVLPPNGPYEITQPSRPIDGVVPMAPFEVLQAPLNSTRNGNATIEPKQQPQVTKIDDLKWNMSKIGHEISNGEDKTKLHALVLLLSLALQALKVLN